MKIVAILFLFLIAISSQARGIQDQEAAQPSAVDPIEQLRLSPEQRQKIRMIAQQTKDERQTTNRRVREAVKFWMALPRGLYRCFRPEPRM